MRRRYAASKAGSTSSIASAVRPARTAAVARAATAGSTPRVRVIAAQSDSRGCAP